MTFQSHLGDYADVVFEARFERGLEDFDHPHALGDDEKIVDKHDALKSVAVVINLEEEAGVQHGPGVSVGGEELGKLLWPEEGALFELIESL